ncbi:enoyl-CoA hydratase/isomerase family protein [Paracoccus sp. (in: a-proteobacteria)]|uniref:enoyl-CoA hydratase/isomerase family protein n=1 Tax=Paracoccus sp. TaxID=267 RepID=UPI003A86CB57
MQGDAGALPSFEFLELRLNRGRLDVLFNRPGQRNAVNSAMSREIGALVEWLEGQTTIRVVTLAGAGGNFCAGGDIKERRAMAQSGRTESRDDIAARNQAAGQTFARFEALPQVTVALVQGAAFGGGMGYACLCDITILTESALMGMPETTLGVTPAQIAPYVVRRIGLSQARALAVTGRRIDATEALRLGVGHHLVADDQGATKLDEVVAQIMRCGPQANAATKAIMNRVGNMPVAELGRFAAERFADLNLSPEGQEGQSAFVEKRRPDWTASAP